MILYLNLYFSYTGIRTPILITGNGSRVTPSESEEITYCIAESSALALHCLEVVVLSKPRATLFSSSRFNHFPFLSDRVSIQPSHAVRYLYSHIGGVSRAIMTTPAARS